MRTLMSGKITTASTPLEDHRVLRMSKKKRIICLPPSLTAIRKS